MQSSNFGNPLCTGKLKQTNTNESKLKLFIQPIDNSIFERHFRTRMPSTGPPTKYIVQYTEQTHQKYYHNES